MPSKTSPAGRGSRKGSPGDLDAIFQGLQASLGPLDGAAIDETLDLVIFSHMVLHLPVAEAVRAHQRFKTQFVDWNEVRISSAKEVQEVLRHGDDPLELAIFLKEFLNRLFLEHHHIGIDFLKERTLSEIRSFFKKIPGFSESTVHLLLAQLKEYGVVPLEAWMHPCVERLGLTKSTATPLQKQKDVFEKISPELVRDFHFYLVEHSREKCVADLANLDCRDCTLLELCPYTRKKGLRKKTTKKTAKKTTKSSTKTSTKAPASRNGAGRRSK